jgi:predicted component of type VI protein secretion system
MSMRRRRNPPPGLSPEQAEAFKQTDITLARVSIIQKGVGAILQEDYAPPEVIAIASEMLAESVTMMREATERRQHLRRMIEEIEE